MPNLVRCASLAVLAAGACVAAESETVDETRTVNVLKPATVEATPARIASLQVPDGFAVTVFAQGLKNPRMLAAGERGEVYVSRRDQGDVLLLRDADGDGRADSEPVTVAHRAGAHGLALHDGKLYVATVKELFAADVRQDGTLGELQMLTGDLPDGGQHPNRVLAFGPDDMLYIGVGSTCNACNETHPEHATLLRSSADGRKRVVFASGLRNTLGFGWHPATGELWGMDHGIDDLGDDEQAEELNRLQMGRMYGWPHVYGAGTINAQTPVPAGISKEEWKARSEPMALGYTAHAAPMQMVFYTGAMFPAEYRGDAFVAMRGSWNRRPASGYEVVRIRFENGTPRAFEPFLRGFLVDGGRAQFGRPVGLAQASDGALLVGDDTNGVIYRIAHAGAKTGNANSDASPPAKPMQEQAARGIGVPLALTRVDATSDAALKIMSPAFGNGAPMPRKYSEYYDGVAPPLRWDRVEGARSYVLIVEDPDAKPMTPFVHWVAWNIPADIVELPEGLHEQLRLTEPEGLMQGRTTRGSHGWFGPRPPAGEPPHHYHFQLFALDRMLDAPLGADRDTVLEAMRGHVLAKGEWVGTYQQEIEPPK